MAQYTGGLTMRNLDISLSVNGGSAWTDISGGANSVTIGGGDRNIGQFHTADGDTPVLGAGKRGALEVTVKVLYTEGGTEAFELIRAAYEAGDEDIKVKYAPKSEVAPNFLFTTANGIIRNHPYPQGEVGNGEPIALEFTVLVPNIVKSVVT